jgi:hypothetical protein
MPYALFDRERQVGEAQPTVKDVWTKALESGADLRRPGRRRAGPARRLSRPRGGEVGLSVVRRPSNQYEFMPLIEGGRTAGGSPGTKRLSVRCRLIDEDLVRASHLG